MTDLRLALIGDQGWDEAANAHRALASVLPDATIVHLPAGAIPEAGVDGIWLLRPPASTDRMVHDPALTWALHVGVPVIGPLAGDEGSTSQVRALPGSRMAVTLGEDPVDLPAHVAGTRTGAEYIAPAQTVWAPMAHRDTQPAVIAAAGAPFAVLLDHPVAVDVGWHPLLSDFAAAASAHHARQRSPRTGGGGFAPLPDDEPRSYVHQMRTREYHWWRPLLALVAGVATYLFIAVILAIPVILATLDQPPESVEELDLTAPIPMLLGNLSLAALIPAALIATRVGHWRPMGKLWSVTGRIRWAWLGLATLATVPIWGTYLIAMWALDGAQVSERPQQWGWLLIITLLTTPLQAAGEEVAFRGALLQGVGAWIRRPVVALIVGTVLSAAFFALAHGSLDPWILIDLAALATAACYLTWRTGGLEAAIVLHVVNNLVIIVMLTLLGGLKEAYISTGSTGAPLPTLVGAVATGIMTFILLAIAKRSGITPKKRGAPALSAANTNT